MAARSRRLIIYLPHRQPIWMLPGASLETVRRRAMKHFDIEVPMNEEAFARALPGAEVLFAWGLARRLADKADALRWLHTPLAGVDRVLSPELLKSAIRVTSSRGVNSVAVAEHTLGLVLAMTRGIADAVRAQAERRWAQQDLYGRQPPLEELSGKLLGILGLGDIGRELAVRARALGMTVWGLARTARPKPDCVDRLLLAGKEQALLRDSDVLVLAVPLTRATHGMIGERQLKKMKRRSSARCARAGSPGPGSTSSPPSRCRPPAPSGPSRRWSSHLTSPERTPSTCRAPPICSCTT
ncbi:MAG: hypothetical protein DMF51_05905 [Acidobacteria bacterium]|nr:MAG: hypothetical protein DMF51_05905 [Acidobacteriota bacterium]